MREDWIECKLEDLLDYEQPTKYIIQEEKYSDEFPTPVLTAGKSFIKGYTDEDFGIFDNLPTIIFDDFTTASQFVNFKFKVKSSAMKILVPTSKLVNLKFAFGAMQVNKVRSETHKRYWISEYSKLTIGLPPLVEQRAIVKKIESLFSSLDAGVADLKKAQQQLKIYRQAVLRQSLDAKKRVSISELIQNLSQGWSPKCLSENVENDEEWAVIKTTAIQHGEFLPYENKKLPKDLEPREQHQIEVGDILITRAGPRIRVGVCCLVRKTKLKLINCDKVYRIKLKDTVVLPEYFELVLNSPDYLKLINDIKTGSSDSGLNLTQDRFLKLEIPLPSIKEQIEIIKQIESRLSVCDSIEQNIAAGLEKAEALRQSILKKAFEGNLLTAQELAECKLAEDYEPAAVLLARIKAEQKQASRPKKKLKA